MPRHNKRMNTFDFNGHAEAMKSSPLGLDLPRMSEGAVVARYQSAPHLVE